MSRPLSNSRVRTKIWPSHGIFAAAKSPTHFQFHFSSVLFSPFIVCRPRKKLAKEEDALVRPTQQHYTTVLNAWLLVTKIMLESDTPLSGIPQRAQRVLDEMQQQAKSDVTLDPTIDQYNAVIETWWNSPEHLRGKMAEHVFQQIL